MNEEMNTHMDSHSSPKRAGSGPNHASNSVVSEKNRK